MGIGRPEVPRLGELGEQRLPVRALSYMNARALCEVGASVAVLSVAAWWFLSGGGRVLAFVAIAALAGVAVVVELPWLNRRRVKYTTYSLDSRFVYMTRGAVFRRSVLLPMRQILNVETVEGPMLRAFGFVNVRFSCITEVESLGPLDAEAVLMIRRAVARASAVIHEG